MDTTMKTTIKHAATWATTMIALVAIAVLVVFRVGPVIEKKFYPVVSDMKGSIVSSNLNSMVVLITGIKIRSCKTLAMRAQVFNGDRWVDGPVNFVNRDGSTLLIEDGRIPADTHFVRELKIAPPGDQVKISMESQCHPFWVTRTDVITIKRQLLTPGVSETRTIPQ